MEEKVKSVNWFRKVRNYITVEPVVICYMFGIVSSTGLLHFEFEKACVAKLKIDPEICGLFDHLDKLGIDCNNATQALENSTDYERHRIVCDAYERSQAEIVFLNSYRYIVTGVVQVIVLLFAGSWSDRVSLRKPCILIPMIADIFNFLVLILSAAYMKEISLEVTGILPHLIISAAGGVPLAVMGIYSYIAIITTEEQRTFRIACMGVTIAAVPIAGNFASGYLYQTIGFINVCFLCVGVVFLGILYGIFILKEPQPISSATQSTGVDNLAFQKNEFPLQVDEIKSFDNDNDGNKDGERNYASLIKDFFDPTLVLDCVKVLTKKRMGNVRGILVLIVVLYFIKWGAFGDHMYAIIISKIRFGWISEIGIWVSYDLASTMIGTVVAIGVLSKWLKVSDALICVVSVIFTLFSKPVFMYAVVAIKPYFYFVATTVDIFDGSRNVAIKSMLSKFVGTDEIAKVYSILGIMDSAQKIFYPTIYSQVYEHTKELFIGSVFVLSELFLLVSLVLYVILYLMARRNARERRTESAKCEQGIENMGADLNEVLKYNEQLN